MATQSNLRGPATIKEMPSRPGARPQARQAPRAALEWRLAPPAPGELLFGEDLVAMVADALRQFTHCNRLAACLLVRLAAVVRCRIDQRIADDGLGRAFALRAVLREALARLARSDEEGAGLLEARYLRQKPIAHFELEGQARATLMRRSRRALEGLAWELWALEQEARKEGYAADMREA